MFLKLMFFFLICFQTIFRFSVKCFCDIFVESHFLNECWEESKMWDENSKWFKELKKWIEENPKGKLTEWFEEKKKNGQTREDCMIAAIEQWFMDEKGKIPEKGYAMKKLHEIEIFQAFIQFDMCECLTCMSVGMMFL